MGEPGKRPVIVSGRAKCCRSQAPHPVHGKDKRFVYLARFVADAAAAGVRGICRLRCWSVLLGLIEGEADRGAELMERAA